MKNIIKALLFTLLPLTAFAQNQGDDLGLGQGATAIVGRTNEARANTAGTSGKANYIGLTAKGDVYTVQIDNATGLSQSNIPISDSVGLSGLGVWPVAGYPITTDAAETGSTVSVINATSHVAKIGDSIIFLSGNADMAWSTVKEVAANTITLSHALPVAPANGDSFWIFRPKLLELSDGINGASGLQVSISRNNQSNDNTFLLALEDAAHATGDAGAKILGVQNPTGAIQFAANGDYIPFGLNRYGAMMVDMSVGIQGDGTQAQTPIRSEDAAFGDTNPVMMSGGVNNGNLTSFNTTANDVTPFAVSGHGLSMSALYYDSLGTLTQSPIKLEDAAVASGDAMMAVGGQRLDVLATGQAGGNNEYVLPIFDTLSRLYVNPWGAAVTDFWQSCSASNTGTSDTAIKAAVASYRIYTTNISCFNTAAVASSFEIKDGATAIYAGGISNSTLTGVAYWEHTFNTPLRGTVNTALNFDMATTATATTCCATGFISPY